MCEIFNAIDMTIFENNFSVNNCDSNCIDTSHHRYHQQPRSCKQIIDKKTILCI